MDATAGRLGAVLSHIASAPEPQPSPHRAAPAAAAEADLDRTPVLIGVARVVSITVHFQ